MGLSHEKIICLEWPKFKININFVFLFGVKPNGTKSQLLPKISFEGFPYSSCSSPDIHVTIVYSSNVKTMRAASSISAMILVYWNNPN